MNRRMFLLGVPGAAAGCFRGRSRRLNVYNWSDYISREAVPTFEREFDAQGTVCDVRKRRRNAGQGDDRQLGLGCRLSFEQLRRADAADGPARKTRSCEVTGHPKSRYTFPIASLGPELEWSIPYMHGATGIVYSSAGPGAHGMG